MIVGGVPLLLKKKSAGGGGGVPTDYLLHYTMDNISGSTLVDESANNHDGTISGATSVTGYIGDALSFDGTNDVVDCGTPFNFSGTNSWSFSLWFKTSVSDAANYIFGTEINDGLYARISSNNTILAKIDDGTNDAFTDGTTNVADNEWHHLAVLNDGPTARFMAYVDGNLEIDISGHSVGSLDDGLDIGAADNYASTGASYFTGQIDHFYLYDRSLTESEITALANEA